MIRMIYNMVQADKKNAQADKINIKAFEKMAEAENKKNQQEYDTKMSLEKLANRKKGILQTSMKDFLQTYEKMMKIDFQEGEGIKELSLSSLSPAQFDEIKTMTSVAGMTMTDGQAIAAFIFKGGISGYIHKEAEINVSVASIRRKQADVVEAQTETICIALDAIKQRADRISDLLVKLNILFRKSIETTERIINEKGKNRSHYTKDNKEYLMTCMNVASTIKTIIDSKLLDEEGEITKQSLEAIVIGENYLNTIQRIASK